MKAERPIVFCATQRTGSAMIFDDFFNVLGGRSVNAEKPYDLVFRKEVKTWPEVWAKVRETNTVRGYVAVKVMFRYTPYFSAVMEGKIPERWSPVLAFDPKRFDRFFGFFADALWVHVERQNVFEQAVSLYFARATHTWEVRVGAKREEQRAQADVPYDRERLMECARGFLKERAQWPRFFDHYGVKPIRIVYEDACGNFPGYLDELLDEAGLVPVSPTPARRMFKVGTKKYAEFAQRLQADMAHEFDPGALTSA